MIDRKEHGTEKQEESWGSQEAMEIARDLTAIIQEMEPGEKISLSIERHPQGRNTDLFDWKISTDNPDHRLLQAPESKIIQVD